MSPPILNGYAGAIEASADHVLATGAEIRPPRPEFGVIAWSCPVRHDMLHLNDDALIMEVLGPEGNLLAQPPHRGESLKAS